MNACYKCDHYRPENPRFGEFEKCAMAPYKFVTWKDPHSCTEYKPEPGTDWQESGQ